MTQLLYHVLPGNIADKLIKDARILLYNMNKTRCRTDQDLNMLLTKKLTYYTTQCTKSNQIQEAIVSDCIWRIVISLPETNGLYD